MRFTGLLEALEALQEVPTAQRLGALLTLDGHDALAAQVARWLRDKQPRIVSLEGKHTLVTSSFNAVFKVRLPADVSSSNT